MKRGSYEKKLARLEVELVRPQGMIKGKSLKVAVISEGHSSAGKGGDIKRHARLNVISHLLSLIPSKDLTPVPWNYPRARRPGTMPVPMSRSPTLP